MKRRGRLCACCKCCFRNDTQEEEDLDVSYLDRSGINEEVVHPKVPKKQVVLPNSNQDKWLAYLLTNLNKMDDIDWVVELLSKIEKD